MRFRFQFGSLLAAGMLAGLLCGSASGQRVRRIAQQEENPPRVPPRLRVRPRLPNAIERLQDMPPQRQEQFLHNNQRFLSLPPEQQAAIRQRLEAWNRLTPE